MNRNTIATDDVGIKQGTAFRKSSILVLGGAILVYVALAYVQRRVVPGALEIAIRNSADLLSLLGVPFLLVLGSARWARKESEGLSVWRNGLSLGSIVLIGCVWIVHLAVRFAGWNFFDLDGLAILLNSTLLAALLAFVFNGTTRFLILGAALLLFSGLQAGIYF
jgi:hypothetical protein